MALGVVCAALLTPAPASAATRYDPRLHFRTYRTAHFDIHAHQGEDALARRLGAIAELVRARFAPTLGVARGRVQVVLVDQTDVSNGWATPFPYDTIELTAVPPTGGELIGNTTDWLELVFTHEYTHILHLDRSRGVMQGVRDVFGRAPLVFPNSFLPIWQIEGLATYEESRMTGEGRVAAGDFRAIVDTAAREHRFASLDRASGGLDDWPVGNAPYAYGAYFHQYLSERFGADRIDVLADATAGRVPLFGTGAFHDVFGESLGSLWRDFREARERDEGAIAGSDAAARRLTQHGFVVSAARLDAAGVLYYRVANADGYPALMRFDGRETRRLAWRVAGNRTAIAGDWVVFDQVGLARSVALYSDLYAVARTGGRVVRLTREARAGHPDVSPDGRQIACVVVRTGHRALALVDFAPGRGVASPRILVDDPAADFSGPRWSPDGTQLVAERRHGGAHELVLVDVATRTVRVLLSRTDARLVTPSWAPDGASVLFAADPADGPFNIFAVGTRGGAVRQLTDSASGAQAPEIRADGSLIYVGYTAAGYDLFSLPPEFRLKAGSRGSWEGSRLEAGSSRLEAGDLQPLDQPVSVPESSSRLKPGAPDVGAPDVGAPDVGAPDVGAPDLGAPDLGAPDVGAPDVVSRTYQPLSTLAPTYWQPVVASDAGETLVGAGTAMADALGRHGYAASAAWSAARARPDWSVSYAYDRWRPTLLASYGDDTDPIRGGEVRSREMFAGVLLSFRHLRWSQTVLGGFDAEKDTAQCSSACRGSARDLRSVRGGWLLDSRRLFPYSVSSEEGVAVEAAWQGSRAALGSDATANAFVLDARAFQRLFSRHTVLALRAAAASSSGEVAGRRVFSAAGPGGGESRFDFDRDTIGLLRGFAAEDVIGTHAAVVNADLRVPLHRVERGAGTFPVFVRAVHGAVFADAANAWDGAFRTADIRYATGGELSLDVVLAYSLRLTAAGGAAWTHDPVAGRDRAALFARLGYAF